MQRLIIKGYKLDKRDILKLGKIELEIKDIHINDQSIINSTFEIYRNNSIFPQKTFVDNSSIELI